MGTVLVAGHMAAGMMNRLNYSVDLRKSSWVADTQENPPAANFSVLISILESSLTHHCHRTLS